ncbi:hypothetical protein RHSIM_Rhsim13G0122500 [Rhododendron simsii]|uniref:Uncharacterized protein n=1 Tax=Rhododendron simsii TaxID=118357 RepID=A0A834FXR3_RHOSS|nr:hypothetical protein RHSIM_Rhsim13G0122500 [Rhododendron simsii]
MSDTVIYLTEDSNCDILDLSLSTILHTVFSHFYTKKIWFPRISSFSLVLNIRHLLLQYAHRICIQRWCNEKGDIVCEICHQFMVVLVLRHTLPIITSEAGNYTITLVMLLLDFATTDVENHWDRFAYLHHGKSIYCYPALSTPTGDSGPPALPQSWITDGA